MNTSGVKIPYRTVTDPQLAEAVTERLEMGWSPHAVAADLRNEGSPLVCAKDYLSGVLRAVRCSWLDRRLLAVASAPPQATPPLKTPGPVVFLEGSQIEVVTYVTISDASSRVPNLCRKRSPGTKEEK